MRVQLKAPFMSILDEAAIRITYFSPIFKRFQTTRSVES